MPRDSKVVPIKREGEAPMPFKTLDLSAMLALPKPKWLIRKVLPETGMVLLFGASNTYKSFVAIDWACHIAHGLDWCGERVKPGTVVYVAGEGAYGAATQRFPAWHIEWNLLGTNPPLRLVPVAVDMTSMEDVARLLVTIREVLTAMVEADPSARLAALFIDTLARSMTGDECNGEVMGAFIKGCAAIQAEFGTAVIVVHHSGWGDKDRSRGHSSLWGAADCRIKATSDPDMLRATVHIERQKDGESGIEWHLQGFKVEVGEDEDGEPVTSLVFKHSDEPVDTSDVSTAEKEVFGVLVRLSQSPGTECRFGVWWDECQREGMKSKKMFDKHVKALLQAGWVAKEGAMYRPDLTR